MPARCLDHPARLAVRPGEGAGYPPGLLERAVAHYRTSTAPGHSPAPMALIPGLLMKLFSLAALFCCLTLGSGSGADALASRGGVVVVANKQDNTASIINAALGTGCKVHPAGIFRG